MDKKLTPGAIFRVPCSAIKADISSNESAFLTLHFVGLFLTLPFIGRGKWKCFIPLWSLVSLCCLHARSQKLEFEVFHMEKF
jgi:hypothetical protein